MPGMTGWPSVGSPKRRGEGEVLVGVEVLAGEEHDLALEPHLADGGDGVVVERGAGRRPRISAPIVPESGATCRSTRGSVMVMRVPPG